LLPYDSLRRDGACHDVLDDEWETYIVVKVIPSDPGKDPTESERLLETVFENMVDGVVVADIVTKRFYAANPALCRMLGCSRREALQLGVQDVHPPESLVRVAQELEKQAARQKSLARDIPVLRRDGSVFYADVKAFPIEFSGQACLMGVFRDVTARKRAEDLLKESEEKYRTLVETAGEAIVTIDRQGVVLFMNTMAATNAGGSPEDFIGKSLGEVFPPEVAERHIAKVREVIDSGEGGDLSGLNLVRGLPRWYSTTIEPMKNAEGKVTAALVVGRDIHDLRQARAELEEYREKMTRAEQLASLGTLSATIAHELTQPLTVSRLSLQEALVDLEAGGCPPEVREALQESLGGITDATFRVERFRNFARRSSREMPTKVQIGEVLARAAKLLEGKGHEKRMSLIVQNLDDLPTIVADEKDMEQMCFALIENAIQAADGEKHHRLVISGENIGAQICLQFEDDCGGIAQEHVDKIFQPFFTTKPPNEGTGLGLCIVERIVGQVRGKVHVENAPGQGVAFCITLPLKGV